MKTFEGRDFANVLCSRFNRRPQFERGSRLARPSTKSHPKSASSAPAPLAKGTMTAAIAEELKKALDFPHIGIETQLPDVSYRWEAKGLTVEGKFHYLALRDGEPTINEFVKLLYDRVPYFCLTRKERKEYVDKYQKSRDLRHMSDMLDKAKKLLIRSKASGKTVGEPGELILFLLLEAVLKAPQMACKMSLKTSEEMPVHGSDAIHLKFDPASGTLTLYWGESKLYATLSDALEEVCTSIKAFRTAKDGKTPRERDIAILCDHMNVDDASAKEAIKKFFDPYESEYMNLCEVYSCFVGFDFAYFKKLSQVEKTKAEDAFKKEYLDRVKSACDLFADKINTHKLHTLRFHFFMIPFPSVEVFRTLYLEKLKG